MSKHDDIPTQVLRIMRDFNLSQAAKWRGRGENGLSRTYAGMASSYTKEIKKREKHEIRSDR